MRQNAILYVPRSTVLEPVMRTTIYTTKKSAELDRTLPSTDYIPNEIKDSYGYESTDSNQYYQSRRTYLRVMHIQIPDTIKHSTSTTAMRTTMSFHPKLETRKAFIFLNKSCWINYEVG